MAEVTVSVLRWAHAVAAALWVGGAIVFALAPRSWTPAPPSAGLREVVAGGVAVFVVTGAILSVQRLSSAPLPPTYAALLALKAALGLWMFVLARQLSGGRRPAQSGWWRQPQAQLAVVGLGVYALAIALRAIYEETIRA